MLDFCREEECCSRALSRFQLSWTREPDAIDVVDLRSVVLICYALQFHLLRPYLVPQTFLQPMLPYSLHLILGFVDFRLEIEPWRRKGARIGYGEVWSVRRHDAWQVWIRELH